MYYIFVDDCLWLKYVGETNAEEETPFGLCLSQSDAKPFETREEAEAVNDKFGLNGEITEIL